MAKPISSYKYWHDRESQVNKKYALDEEGYARELHRYYDYALDQINKEINSFYQKYADAEGIKMSTAKSRVSKVDIEEYERKAKEYVEKKKFTQKANAEMRLYNTTMKINRLELLKAKIGLETVAASSDAEKYMRDILQGRTIQEIERQAGILGESIGTNVKDVNSLIDASFKNASWSERIWNNQKLLQTELDKLLNNGLVQGKGSTALARDLRKAIDATKYNAERLMRTELCRVRSDAQLESFKKNEFEEYMYLTLSSAPFTKSKVCEVCKALDGKTFPIKDAEVGINLPPMHPNCRCSIAAYESESEYNEWLNEGEKLKPMDSMNYAMIGTPLNLGQNHTLNGEIFTNKGFGGKLGGNTNMKVLKLPKGTLGVSKDGINWLADGEYVVTKKNNIKFNGKEYESYELKKPDELTLNEAEKLSKQINEEIGEAKTVKEAEDINARAERMEKHGLKKLSEQLPEAKKAYDEAVKKGDKTEIAKAKKKYADYKKKEIEFTESAKARKEYIDTLKEIKEIEKQANALINPTDMSKVYQDIWYDDVTLKDWLNKKNSISKKLDYFTDKLKVDSNPKWQELFDLTKKFEAEGKKYEKYLKEFDAKKAEIDKLNNKLEDLANKLANKKSSSYKMGDKAAYTEAAKSKANRFTDAKKSYDSLIDKCAEVWKKLPEPIKDAIHRYTNTYHPVNEPLRGYEYGTSKFVGRNNIDWDNIGVNYKGYGKGFVKDWINKMSDGIGRSTYNQDYWFVRGCRYGGMDKFFGCDMNLLRNGSTQDLQQLVGKKIWEHGFMSCGSAKGTGFGGDVRLNIYCPRGTKMIYAEPFSSFGMGDGRHWNGNTRQKIIGSENETILQCNTQFRVTKIKRENGYVVADIEVIAQKGFKK